MKECYDLLYLEDFDGEIYEFNCYDLLSLSEDFVGDIHEAIYVSIYVSINIELI
jgi:hypothetical protein